MCIINFSELTINNQKWFYLKKLDSTQSKNLIKKQISKTLEPYLKPKKL